MIIPGQFGLPRNDHWKVLYKVPVFFADRKSKMATTAGHRLTLDPMGKCSNAFFSETTNMMKAKLYMNVHWIFISEQKT
jgi:G:T/U-mismatch repair DNA glycosylase